MVGFVGFVPGIEQLAVRARTLLARSSGRVVIGIAGAPGAGKSTLALDLVSVFAEALDGAAPDEAAYLPMDGFHLADVELERLGLREVKGAPETFDVEGYAAALRRVSAGGPGVIYVPGFSRDLEQPIAGAIAIEPTARLVITEGNYLLHDSGGWAQVRDLLDEAWFVETDKTQRRDDLIARHVRFGKSPEAATTWVDRSDEANARLVATTQGRADLVVRRLSA